MKKQIVIIGAGQAGLSLGRTLQKSGKDFLILEKNPSIGDNWRKRFDSLVLFTPARYSALPDLEMALPPKSQPTKNQIADYFERYAAHFELPIYLNHAVESLTKEGNGFVIKTAHGEIFAEQVVVASGFCERPAIPSWAADLSIPYIHSASYKSPVSVKGKKVLVVGTGNSAAQIAAELTKYFDVTWSVNRKPNFAPLYIFGRSVLWFADKLGLMDKSLSEKKRKKGEQIYLFGDLKQKLKQTKRKTEIVSASGASVIDTKGKQEVFDFVVLATGFLPNYDFIQILGFENNLDQLRAQEGFSLVEGLYFLGIPHQRTRSSTLIFGAQKDAIHLAKHL